MRNVLIILSAVVCGLLAATAMWAFVGFVLSAIWVYAVQAIWPAMPDILWWQFSLMALGVSVVTGLLTRSKS